MIKSAKNLQKGDTFASSDGRGNETVLFNRTGPKGSRAIRTTRSDHNWPNAKKVEVFERDIEEENQMWSDGVAANLEEEGGL